MNAPIGDPDVRRIENRERQLRRIARKQEEKERRGYSSTVRICPNCGTAVGSCGFCVLCGTAGV
jgi:heterodisulfide reductase subunit C